MPNAAAPDPTAGILANANTMPEDAFVECMKATRASYYTNASYLEFQSGVLKQLSIRKAMLERDPGSEAEAGRMAKEVSAQKQIMDAVAARQPFLKRRLAHALDRMKDKKMTADSIEGIQNLCERRNWNDIRATVQATDCIMGSIALGPGDKRLLDDEMWKRGIEMAMILHERELAMSDRMYGHAIKPNLERIYAYTVMAAYSTGLQSVMESDDFASRILGPLAGRLLGSATMQRIVNKAVDSKSAEMTASLAQSARRAAA